MAVIEAAPEDIQTLTEIQEVLIKAKQILITGGWCKGKRENEHGQHCAIGAIEKAVFGDVANRSFIRDSPFCNAGVALSEACRDERNTGVVSFNDLHAYYIDEILYLFDKAIKEYA